MNFKEILELIDKVADSGISAVEVEQAGTKVRIEGKSSEKHVFVTGAEMKSESHAMPAMPMIAAVSSPESKKEEEKKASESDPSMHILTSPIVGTFYRAASPESGPFVEVGSRIKKGQVLCIVEAMKLMNEIESDVDGVIEKIFPSNAQPVEFGEPLFTIKV
ncbi:MAG TPA: acetyl-CoA carboxylase biotin carboxyl carrier protein [Thermoanaerobaculia bacterium]|nr:acetyl-CoA carboxylase biotin carboxyl carrier protein [Thermoanaerobaculia bacterium]